MRRMNRLVVLAIAVLPVGCGPQNSPTPVSDVVDVKMGAGVRLIGLKGGEVFALVDADNVLLFPRDTTCGWRTILQVDKQQQLLCGIVDHVDTIACGSVRKWFVFDCETRSVLASGTQDEVEASVLQQLGRPVDFSTMISPSLAERLNH